MTRLISVRTIERGGVGETDRGVGGVNMMSGSRARLRSTPLRLTRVLYELDCGEEPVVWASGRCRTHERPLEPAQRGQLLLTTRRLVVTGTAAPVDSTLFPTDLVEITESLPLRIIVCHADDSWFAFAGGGRRLRRLIAGLEELVPVLG